MEKNIITFQENTSSVTLLCGDVLEEIKRIDNESTQVISNKNSTNILKPNQKLCPICGSPMHKRSKKCRTCYVQEHQHPENYIEKICKKCGKVYTLHISLTKNNNGNYCSRSCARSGSPTKKRTSAIVTCANCGKIFRKYNSEIAKNRGDKHFCSTDCWYSYNQKDNHYLWEGGQNERRSSDGIAWRKEILMRDKYFCRICHTNQNLEVHHIYPFGKYPSKRWNISNGITLCYNCHTGLKCKELDYAEILEFITTIPLEIWHINN